MSGVSRRFRMNLPCVSGQGWVWRVAALLLLAFCALLPAMAQQRREREPNSVYAERRAKLASNIDGPVVLLGYTGREVEAQSLHLRAGRKFLLPHRPQRRAGRADPPAAHWQQGPKRRLGRAARNLFPAGQESGQREVERRAHVAQRSRDRVAHGLRAG